MPAVNNYFKRSDPRDQLTEEERELIEKEEKISSLKEGIVANEEILINIKSLVKKIDVIGMYLDSTENSHKLINELKVLYFDVSEKLTNCYTALEELEKGERNESTNPDR